MRALLVAFVAGSWWLQQQGELPTRWTMLGALCATGLLVGASSRLTCRARTAARWATGVAFVLVIGWSWAAWRADIRLAHWLDPALAGRDIEVGGVVAELPDEADHGIRFVLDVQAWAPVASPATASEAPPPRRLVLTWKEPPVRLEPGQRYRLVVRLRRPRGLANPHGFDYAYWLLAKGLDATGYVSSGEALPASSSMSPGVRVAMWRSRLRDRLRAALPEDARYGAVLVALVIGDQRGIAQDDWDVFRRTGISHLVSISGLHITMIAGLAGALARMLWRHSFGFGRRVRRPLPLRWPAQKAALVVALFVAVGYAAIAGMQIPAIRTVSMLAVAAMALWGDRAPPASMVLAWAAGVAVAIDPWAVMLPGFWLSFGAVAVIFLHGQDRSDMTKNGAPEHPAPRLTERWRTGLANAVHTQWAVTIGLVPLTLLLFGQVSVVSVVANAVAIPVVSLLVTPLALCGAFLPSDFASVALAVAHRLLIHLVDGLAWLATPSWAVWEAAHPGFLATASAMVGVVLMLMPWPRPIVSLAKIGNGMPIASRALMRCAGALAMVPMIVSAGEPIGESEFRMTALDVGQGTAVLVETRRHALLYDTGPGYTSGSSAGGQVIVPFLRAQGVRRLDMLVISHEDADHAGGTRDVLKSVAVAEARTAAPAGHPLLPAVPGGWQPCESGQRWAWDGVQFEILHPAQGDAERPQLASNARSCVLRIATPHRSALLTGDIGEREELSLIGRESSDRVHADILLVPHHGSGTSSNGAFLRAVAPEVAVFQLGFANRYRHPRSDVWQRYGRLGIARYRTDETGAVTVATQGEAYEMTSYRQQHRRYWRDAPPAPS